MNPPDRVCPLTHGPSGEGHLPTDRYVCTACTGTLRGLLTDLGGLMTDLDVALTGMVRFTAQRSSQPAEQVDEQRPQTAAITRLPFGPGPSEAAWVARQTILIWADWITAVRGHTLPQTWTDVGTYLRTALDWTARHPTGPQCIDELTASIRQARRAIDRPADRHYLGMCQAQRPGTPTATCTQALYAPDTATTVTCPRCATVWGVQALRAAMIARIEHHRLAAVDAERVLAQVGIDIPAMLIRQWKHRGQLPTAGVDQKGRPLYEIGAILARNAQTAPDAQAS